MGLRKFRSLPDEDDLGGYRNDPGWYEGRFEVEYLRTMHCWGLRDQFNGVFTSCTPNTEQGAQELLCYMNKNEVA